MNDAKVILAPETLIAGKGGICRVARMMGRALAERGIDTKAIVLSDKGPTPDIALPTVGCGESRLRFAAQLHLATFSRTHFIYDSVSMAQAHCRLPLLRRPFMVFIHGIEVWEDNKPQYVAWAKRADMLMANSAYTRDRANKLHGGLGHARVCWLATEADEPLPRVDRTNLTPTALIIGRMDPGGGYKGHRELIDAWPQVNAAVPGAKLVIAGTGPGLDFIRDRAAQSPAAAHIEVAGPVPETAMEQLWSRATLFVMPSRGEGFGLVYIEAMRHGLPIIASIHDAAPEVNIHGQTGYNVDMNDPNDLPARLIELLGDRALSAKFGDNGRQRWFENFRYSAFRDRFLPHVEEFLARKS